MMRFLKRQGDNKKPVGLASVGHLEIAVMEILWKQGESNVHQVAQSLERPLAYTTVMTTLDRLYKKGLLERRKSEHPHHVLDGPGHAEPLQGNLARRPGRERH